MDATTDEDVTAANAKGNPDAREKFEQYSLVDKIWPGLTTSSKGFDEGLFSVFLSYLQDADSQIRQFHHKLAFGTLGHTLDLVGVLRDSRSRPLQEIFQNIDDNAMRRSYELAVRVWLGINVNSSAIAVGPIAPDERPHEWPMNTSLEAVIKKNIFRECSGNVTKEYVKVEGAFTAAYLVKVCGMKLSWTDHLTDHLRVDAKGQLLTVYRHKICLWNHLQSAEFCPIPATVLEEALDTLNLLFPFNDPSTKQLLKDEGQLAFYGLGFCGRDRELDLSKYKYWNEELEALYDTFRRPPQTWRQLAFDRRNMMEWSAFWIMILVAVLTLVSIPCSIVQTVYTVKSYRATLAQRNIGRG